MQDLRIEVNSGQLSVWLNGQPIGRQVSKLTFTAEGEGSAVKMALSLDGTAEFDFGDGGATPSLFVDDLVKAVHRGTISL